MSPTLAGGFFTTESLGKPRVGSKSSDKCPCKRYSEERHMESRGESLESQGRDWSDVATT